MPQMTREFDRMEPDIYPTQGYLGWFFYLTASMRKIISKSGQNHLWAYAAMSKTIVLSIYFWYCTARNKAVMVGPVALDWPCNCAFWWVCGCCEILHAILIVIAQNAIFCIFGTWRVGVGWGWEGCIWGWWWLNLLFMGSNLVCVACVAFEYQGVRMLLEVGVARGPGSEYN